MVVVGLPRGHSIAPTFQVFQHVPYEMNLTGRNKRNSYHQKQEDPEHVHAYWATPQIFPGRNPKPRPSRVNPRPETQNQLKTSCTRQKPKTRSGAGQHSRPEPETLQPKPWTLYTNCRDPQALNPRS